jgi:hypothetical protein
MMALRRIQEGVVRAPSLRRLPSSAPHKGAGILRLIFLGILLRFKENKSSSTSQEGKAFSDVPWVGGLAVTEPRRMYFVA